MNQELQALLNSPEISAVLSDDFKHEAGFITEEEAIIDLCTFELEKLEQKEKEINSILVFAESADMEDTVSVARVENMLLQMFPETEEEMKGKLGDRIQTAGIKAKKRVQAAVKQILLAIKKFVRKMLNNDKGTIKKGNKVIAELKKKSSYIKTKNLFKGRAGFFVEDGGMIIWGKAPTTILSHLKNINDIAWDKWIDESVTLFSESIGTADKLHKHVGKIAPIKGGEKAFARVSLTTGSMYNAAVLFKAGKAPSDVTAEYKWTGTLANRFASANYKFNGTSGYNRDAIVEVAEESIKAFDKIVELNKILDDETLFDQVDKDGNLYRKPFTAFITSTLKSYVKYYRTVAKAGISLAANAAKAKDVSGEEKDD